MIRRPPRSTLFPTRRSSDLVAPRFRRMEPGRIEFVPRRDHSRDLLPGRRQNGQTAGRRHSRRRQTKREDRKSTRLNSSHVAISYAVFCLKKKKKTYPTTYCI